VPYGLTVRYRMGMAQGRRLTAEDWARTALAALADDGVAAVAVEPLAARLGTTKGSFYWHFPNRDALVEAALALWEREHTDGPIAEVDAEPDPAQRLRALFASVTEHALHDRTEVHLLAAADHPLVAPAMARVVSRRLVYLAAQFTALGLSEDEARRRSLLAYSAYLGHAQLAAHVPGVLADATDSSYLDSVMNALLP